MYRSSNFNSTFHLIYYLWSMWHTQNFVNYITICRLLMLKRKRGLCLRHFIAWVIRVLHTFLQVSWFLFFFKARRWAELICGYVSDKFRQIKIRLKNFKKKKKKEFPRETTKLTSIPGLFLSGLLRTNHIFPKKKSCSFFLFKGRSQHDHNNMIFTYLKT